MVWQDEDNYIAASSRIIDAHTGMTEGYTILVKRLDFDDIDGGEVSVGEETNLLFYPDVNDIYGFAMEAMQYLRVVHKLWGKTVALSAQNQYNSA